MIKKKEIRPALDALKTIRMGKIEDKDFRNKVITIHLKLLAEQKKFESDYSDMRTAFLASYKDEQAKVVELQEELRLERDPVKHAEIANEIRTHKDYLEAVKDFNEQTEQEGEKEVKIDAIDMDKFVEEYQKQDYDMGVVEALFPLFATK